MRAAAFPPRRASQLVRYIVPAAFLMCLIYYLAPSYVPSGSNVGASWRSSGASSPGKHPIDVLIQSAEQEYTQKMGKASKTLSEAAARYRERRGRHPPPGFKEWYEFAEKHNVVMVEDFWDQVYHDLNPFWAIDANQTRREAWDFEMTINIRDHVASAGSDWFWTQIWLKLIKTVEHLLPDMDIALNAMDEPRMVVPWEDINAYMQKEQKSRKLIAPKSVVTEFSKLPPVTSSGDNPAKARDKAWDTKTAPYWLIARRGCAPNSLARTSPTLKTFDASPEFSPSYSRPHMNNGYVSNYTLSTEFCHQPDLQGLEGIFIRPLSTSATKVLFPMFGGSKLATNNEILLPAPMYWNEEARFTGSGAHGPPWEQKVGDMIWRGVATGGRNNATNWKGFQRHRFVAMNNGTKITRAESGMEKPTTFDMPNGRNGPHIASQSDGLMGQWVDSFADVGFTDLFCDDKLPKEETAEGKCPYTNDEYDVVLARTLDEQYSFKYLPDIDGNSFSGRYLGFLRSTSVPIKSTLWREWHDSRLVAWKHFVPMDNRFQDYYGIMEYFRGYITRSQDGLETVKVQGHDAEAKKIALDGEAWAAKVLRKEDMQVYVLRLLLEYARISDERRDSMGWVGDLV